MINLNPIATETGDQNFDPSPENITTESNSTDPADTPSPATTQQRRRTHINPALLIAIADDAGCQLEELQENPNIAVGLCPFHPPYTNRGARTLEIDISRGLFHCAQCNIQGDTAVFAALLWGVAVVEARAWLQDPAHARAQRPLPPNYENPPSRNEPPRLQNTALLTRALPIMEANLNHPQAVRFLTKLDIQLQEARERLHLGYSDNRSLMTGLQRTDLEPYEIEQSNLFRGAQKHERFHNGIVIPNLDFINGVNCYISIPATTPNHGTRWSRQPPDFTVLPGHRPFLLGSHRVPANTQRVLFTNDPRLYIVLNCRTDVPTLMQISNAAPTVAANYLRYVRCREIIILHHDPDAALEISHQLTQHGINNLPLKPEWANEQLDGNRRDLRPLNLPLNQLSDIQLLAPPQQTPDQQALDQPDPAP